MRESVVGVIWTIVFRSAGRYFHERIVLCHVLRTYF